MKYDTVIFDLDGTLLDTLDDLRDSVNFVLEKHGMPLRTRDEIRAFVGSGVRNLMSLSVRGGEANPDFEEYLTEFKAHYKDNAMVKTAPYKGIKELLNELKKRGYKIAVVSNKLDEAVKNLCRYYFEGLCDIAIGEKENVRKKPAPDSVFAAMDYLNAVPEKSVYVGDSEVDVETARNANIDGIFVTWGFRDEKRLIEAGGRVFARSPEEIINLL